MLLSRISLASLRTFSEVARQGSLSLAAEQLCISPSAVSHQMKLLEQHLDTALFIRRARGVELTGAGKHLAEYAIRSMLQLEQGLQRATQASQRQLSVAAIPAITQLWLVPKLHRFYALHPDIELSIIDQDALTDFNQQAIDLHLHFGSGECIELKKSVNFIKIEFIDQGCGIPLTSFSFRDKNNNELFEHNNYSFGQRHLVISDKTLLSKTKFIYHSTCEGPLIQLVVLYE